VTPASGTLGSVHVEEIALEALTRGIVQAAVRTEFALGEAKALAIDAHDGVAAVLVIRRRRDDAWIVDVARFVDQAGLWESIGSGGGTYGDLLIDHDSNVPPSLGPIVTGWSLPEDRGLAAIGGFVVGATYAVEVAVGDRIRRVPVTPGSSAFVVAVPVRDEDELDAIDVRGIDRSGAVIDSTAARKEERRTAQPGITVAEALALADGSVATVRGVLLALPGEPPMLCDDVDHGPPPRCRGPRIRLDIDAPLPPTMVEEGSVSLLMMMVSGVVRDGVLTPTE